MQALLRNGLEGRLQSMLNNMHYNQNRGQSQTRSCPNRESLLNTINEHSFAIDDLLLYLDTHPDDQEAMRHFHEQLDRRKEALSLYAANYGPLTIDTADDTNSCSWEWAMQPWPWEGSCRGGACQ